MQMLAADLGGASLAMLWATHPHSDHIGGAPEVLARFRVESYVDNGRDCAKSEVKRARSAESFVKTFKRDYVYLNKLETAAAVLGQLQSWFDDYHEVHPHSGLKMQSRPARASRWIRRSSMSSTTWPKFADTCTVRVHVVDSAESGTFKFDRYTPTDLTHTKHSCTVM